MFAKSTFFWPSVCQWLSLYLTITSGFSEVFEVFLQNSDLLFIFQEQNWLKGRNLGCPQCLHVVVTQGQCFFAQSGRDRFLFAQVYLTATEKDLINMGKSDIIKLARETVQSFRTNIYACF